MNSLESAPLSVLWLIRISEVFADFSTEIIHGISGVLSKKLGSEYYLVHTTDPASVRASDAAKFIRWNLPIEHAWPCNPQTMDGFVEKAAQALARKFGARSPQALFIGLLDPSASNRYYKTLASNLRGRALQLFSKPIAALNDAQAQDHTLPTLFCLIGKEGLFCGMQSPRSSNGLYPGGTKYISQNAPDTISRAGAKIAEALHYLTMHLAPMRQGGHWLELGASPGGMTSELLARGYQVTAIDRAPLDTRLHGRANLLFGMLDVAAFKPDASTRFDAILSDMNGDPRESIRQVVRLSKNLVPHGRIIFTLKTTGISTFSEMNQLDQAVVGTAAAAGLELLAKTHLTYNRHELTLFFQSGSDL